MARSRVDEDVALGIRRDAADLAEIGVVRHRQRCHGVKRDVGRGRLCEQRERQQKHFHFAPPCRISFCTRHDSISPTMISFGLRQSIMWTTWNPPNSLLAWPNLPMTRP